MRWARWILLTLVIAANAAALLVWRHRTEHRFDGPIREAARRYGVPEGLVRAVVWQESRFDPDARGAAGELGLMQLMEDASLEWAAASQAPGFSHTHALDPVTNTLAGTYYLAKLLRRYAHTDDPLPYALADYNAGRGNVLRWMKGPAATNSAAFLEAIGYPGTRRYVDSISERYRGRTR